MARAFTGSGSPTTTTLPGGNITIVVGDIYYDTTNNNFYVCTTPGIPANALWTKFSAGGVSSIIAGTGITVSGTTNVTVSAVVPTTVVKTGSKNDTDYATRSLTFVDIDATNLSYTATLATGTKTIVWVSATCWQATTGESGCIGVFDSVANEVIYYSQMVPNGSFTNAESPLAFSCLIVGDGSSHTIKLQFASQSNTSNFVVSNPSSASALRFPGGTWVQMIIQTFVSN